PSLVHRLDRETSGVILIAKQDTALSKLSKQFNERRVKKNYQAIVFGRPENSSIKAPIGWHPALWPKWRVMEKDGKPAETVFQIAETTNEFSLLELQPLTGRTHQLRIHLAHIGHPIVGDHTYGRTPNKELELTESQKVTRHLLHAASLTFRHPVSNQEVVLKAALPKDMVEFWNSRKKTR
ncbi:MAG: RluA family pseudouridine synthase, partial [Blastocatellia bacterium]|nr:RluA family pseudouridine synthase [Blastocatellia bacterium]